MLQEATDGGTVLMQATYAYDAFGNRLEKDVWTQSSGLTTTTRFGYDGWKVRQDASGTPASYVGAENWDVWADLSGSNSLTTRYVHGDGVDELYATVSSGGAVSGYLSDHLGSVRVVTNAAGSALDTVSYDAWGNVASESNPPARGRPGYAGYEYDAETGQYFVHARYYGPGMSRFTTQDPLGLQPDYNAYRPVHNGPTDATDPSGLFDVNTLDDQLRDRSPAVYKWLVQEEGGFFVAKKHGLGTLFDPNVEYKWVKDKGRWVPEITINVKYSDQEALDAVVKLVTEGDGELARKYRYYWEQKNRAEAPVLSQVQSSALRKETTDTGKPLPVDTKLDGLWSGSEREAIETGKAQAGPGYDPKILTPEERQLLAAVALERFKRMEEAGFVGRFVHTPRHRRITEFSTQYLTYVDLGPWPGREKEGVEIGAVVQSELVSNPDWLHWRVKQGLGLPSLRNSDEGPNFSPFGRSRSEDDPQPRRESLVARKVQLVPVGAGSPKFRTPAKVIDTYQDLKAEDNPFQDIYDALDLLPLAGTAKRIVEAAADWERRQDKGMVLLEHGPGIAISFAGDVVVVGGPLVKGVDVTLKAGRAISLARKGKALGAVAVGGSELTHTEARALQVLAGGELSGAGRAGMLETEWAANGARMGQPKIIILVGEGEAAGEGAKLPVLVGEGSGSCTFNVNGRIFNSRAELDEYVRLLRAQRRAENTPLLPAPSKPPLPPAEADVRGVPRWTWSGHQNAAQAEQQLAQSVHSLPDQAVVRWGDPIGSHGADVISVNMRTGEVTLWDAKFRSADVAIQPSPTFAPGSNRLANAIREATDTIRVNQTLPVSIRQSALQNLQQGNVTTRTVGFGNARNSTLR